MSALTPLLPPLIVGTDRRPAPHGLLPPELEERFEQGDESRRLLDAAAALRLLEPALPLPRSDDPVPEAAPQERLPRCSPWVARLLVELLAGPDVDLLDELLAGLARCGSVPPPELLPALLDAGTRAPSLRSPLRTAIGERGRWLARQHRVWEWVDASLLETSWSRLPQRDRLERLAWLRRANPTLARRIVEQQWERETEEMRGDMIALFAIEPTSEELPLLERGRDDRSREVRQRAEPTMMPLLIDERVLLERLEGEPDPRRGPWRELLDRPVAWSASLAQGILRIVGERVTDPTSQPWHWISLLEHAARLLPPARATEVEAMIQGGAGHWQGLLERLAARLRLRGAIAAALEKERSRSRSRRRGAADGKR